MAELPADYVREPIFVKCEGTGCPPAYPTYPICPMCGEFVDRLADGKMDIHHRRDILAELERGDFA